ncbi:MAG: non-heme iron oxygenase ferredoxin subunit [Pirellulales bacterium]
MPDFVSVAPLSDIPDPGKLLAEVDEQLVVVIRVGDAVYCIDDVCTHDGGPLSEGELDAAHCTIACPRHGAKFDIKDGRALTMPATKATRAHEAKVVEGQVLVRLNDS